MHQHLLTYTALADKDPTYGHTKTLLQRQAFEERRLEEEHIKLHHDFHKGVTADQKPDVDLPTSSSKIHSI